MWSSPARIARKRLRKQESFMFSHVIIGSNDIARPEAF